MENNRLKKIVETKIKYDETFWINSFNKYFNHLSKEKTENIIDFFDKTSLSENEIINLLNEYLINEKVTNYAKKVDSDTLIKLLDNAIDGIKLQSRKKEINKINDSINSNIDKIIIENLDLVWKTFLKIQNDKLNKILSFVKDEPLFFYEERRLLSKLEIVAYRKELGINIEKIIPLIDLYDNEFVIYDINNEEFQVLNISDDSIRPLKSVDEYIILLEKMNN